MDFIIFTSVTSIFFQRSIGAYQIAHFLREHGYTVQVIDFTDHFSAEELIALLDKFITDETLAIGISSTFYSPTESQTKFIHNDRNKFEFSILPENILKAVQHAKTRNSRIKVVVGGAKSEDAKKIGCVDAVIHGYAEDKILSYLNDLRAPVKKNYIPIRVEGCTVISDDPLDKKFSIETLNHRFTEQDVVLPNETLPLEVSRGCIFKCSFCAFPLNGKSKFDYLRDPEQIKDELTHNFEKYGTTNYFLCDDTFNDSTMKIERLHKAITSLPFKVNFTTYLRLDLLNAHREQVPMLKEMGLASPFFGIESLNQKSASSIGKGMKVERAKEFLLELYHDHWNEEIPITCSFIVGLPHETKETVRSTYEWIKTTPLSSVFFPLTLTMKSFYKSELEENYQKYGYVLSNDGSWTNDHFTSEEATQLTEEFNQERMRKEDTPSSWFLMTLLNNGYSLNEARKIKTKDLNYARILRKRQTNVREYKSKLFQINTTYRGIQ
jgi:radical SAM superfamily enzyme YgiQ (UPF0313 family)